MMNMSRMMVRSFSSTTVNPFKVAVLGAAGGIGQPLSLLLKKNPKVTDLRLYDLRLAKGVAADLSHIPVNSTVSGYEPGEIKQALEGSDLVIIPAGVPRKPGMTRDDLFDTNAGIVRDLADEVSKYASNACVLVVSNPVNSTVPIVKEIFKKRGVYDPKKLFGVTTLDTIRGKRFLSEASKTDPALEKISIVGGHSGITIVPLISQTPHKNLPKDVRDNIIHRIQFGGDEVVKAKNGAGSATLSMAEAGARFADKVMMGFLGEKDVITASFVDSPDYKAEGLDFFASPVLLGRNGVEKILSVGSMSAEEKEMLEKAKETLKVNIKRGVDFANKK